MVQYYHVHCLFTRVMPAARAWVFNAGSELLGWDDLEAKQQATVTALIAEGLAAKAAAVSWPRCLGRAPGCGGCEGCGGGGCGGG